MKANEALAEFVRAGLTAGQSRDDLAAAMASAGWAPRDIDSALGAWADAPGMVPVPRPRAYVSAREALQYGLLFLSLGMVAWHVVQLGFDIIASLIPDLADPPYGAPPASRWSMAALITFTPLFVWLNRRANRDTASDPGRRRSLVRKWFASITLLIALMTLLGDAVFTVYALLNGELTARFVANVALVAVVAGLVVAYYRDEMDG